MTRRQHAREDLMAEARALVERVELAVPAWDEPVVAGFWRDGRLSVYFGEDPVYHFDAERRLRKAFVSGKLHRAGRAGLVRLTRETPERGSALLRHAFSREETADFLEAMKRRLAGLADAFERSTVGVLREHPAGADVAERVHQQLKQLLTNEPRVAPSISRR